MGRQVLRLAVLWIPVFGYAQGLGSLKTVTVSVPDLSRYVRNGDVLLVLGKALFWDTQVGSDGRTACGTCHFHAGSDHRIQNQLSNPGGTFVPNQRLTWNDFPFRNTSQRVGSAGIVRRIFAGLAGDGTETGVDIPDLVFRIGDLNVRQVTTRNAPSVINAIFNARNFRDGRASDVFTGLTPFGDSDPNPNAIAVVNGTLEAEMVRIVSSSLASQAVAPPMNTVEMSYVGRTWPILGKKLLPASPLAYQRVSLDDSVLGPYANRNGPGLDPAYTYLSLVEAAFQPAYWDSEQLVDAAGHIPKNRQQPTYTIAESNFALFFGLAIQAYESTLVADDSRFDQFMEGKHDVLTPEEHAGLLDFQTQEFCQFCHTGPEMTRASISSVHARGDIDPVLTGVPTPLHYVSADTGFFNTGVRPVSEDPGLDGSDDFGIPFSFAARALLQPLGITGAFKVPALRNVELTGPYFHNGGQASLEQVLDFYARGGDVPASPGLPVEIIPVPLNDAVKGEIVAFLKSLTDDRVRFERAPFDHPELCVPIGYPDSPDSDPRFPGSAVDRWAEVPAVGRDGNSVPLQTFEELLKGIGADGTRAHTLDQPCMIRQ